MKTKTKNLDKIINEYKELKHLAYYDSLTQLLNRNWLYKNINTIDKKYVYFIDINNLHKINKQGHTVGDKHIQYVTRIIDMNKNDILIRYGGDEFVLFSNEKNIIETNNIITVGCSEIKNDINNAIDVADRDMIIKKRG